MAGGEGAGAGRRRENVVLGVPAQSGLPQT